MTELRCITAEPLGADIIELFENGLAMAKRGEISSAAVAIVLRDGATETAWSKPPSQGLLMGCVSHLLFRLNKRLDDAS